MMQRAEAARVLKVTATADRGEVEQAFRSAARHDHPDTGGDAAGFDRLVQARAVLREAPASPGEAPIVVPRSTMRRHRWNRLRRKLLRRLGVDQPPRVQ